MTEHHSVAIIGAGPGGYVAAIRCSQLGLRPVLIDQAALGGLCLNQGCIPSKAMLRSAELMRSLRHVSGLESGGLGLQPGGARRTPATRTDPAERWLPDLDAAYRAAATQRDRAVAHLLQGLANLLQANDVTVLRGTARLLSDHALEVVGAEPAHTLEYENLVIATGSHAARLPVPGGGLPGVVDSDQALALTGPPRRAVIIGGGPVGVEWAEVWHAFGSEVTILEQLPQLVPSEEPEIGRELARLFRRKGIAWRTEARVEEIHAREESLDVVAAANGRQESFPADLVLAAVGRRPNVEGLNLAAAGVRVEPWGIPTDRGIRTNVPHIYAVGDVTGRSFLAHVASHQGIVAAETIAGEGAPFDDRAVPAVIFTDPEIASVGLREQDAARQYPAVRVGRFPLAASGRAWASGETDGFAKIIASADSGQVLGVHLICPRAGDLIAEGALAIRLGATLQDLAHTIHPHPTFSEVLMEAAWAALGSPIHIPPRR